MFISDQSVHYFNGRNNPIRSNTVVAAIKLDITDITLSDMMSCHVHPSWSIKVSVEQTQ